VSRGRALGLLVIALGASIACGGSPAPASKPSPARADPPLHEGPLTDYIPAAGLRWMVVGSPRALARHPSLAPAIALLLPKERLDAFARGSGVDLRQVDAALAAGFDYSTLYVVAPPEPASVEARFRERLVSEPVQARPHPQITRLTGIVGQTPQTLVRVEERLVAVAVGSALPARIVELFALRKLRKSRPALSGSALSSLPSELERAPLRFYAPGPFGAEWTRGARGLLAAATAVGVVASPQPGGRVQVRVVVAGDWSGAVHEAASALQAVWDDLSQSGTGKLLGLNEPVSGPVIEPAENLLELRVELDALTLARGLRAAVEADVWEILDIPRPQ
jgi:hypothetical protein